MYSFCVVPIIDPVFPCNISMVTCVKYVGDFFAETELSTEMVPMHVNSQPALMRKWDGSLFPSSPPPSPKGGSTQI